MPTTTAPCPRSVLFLLLVLPALVLPVAAQGFPVVVENTLDVARVQEPVASGLALPVEVPLTNPNANLMLVDSNGSPVPVQFKVLSRWWGTREDVSRPCKWILVEFNADVPALGSSMYYIRAGTRTTGQIWHLDQPTQVVVGTGAAEFTISKTEFSVFDQVKVGDQVVTGAPGALVMKGTSGTPLAITVTDTKLEESGSVRTVLCQKGAIGALGLTFTARYFFFTGRSDVKLDFRLENPGCYGEVSNTGVPATAHFEELSMAVHLNSGDGSVVRSSGDTNSNGLPYTLAQLYGSPTSNLNMLSGFSFTETAMGQIVGFGDRFDGAIAVNGSNGSCVVAVDRFWQNYPKGFTAHGDRLSIDLWPSYGNGPTFGGQYGTLIDPNLDTLASSYYRFEGGRWKTHTMRFDFRGAQGFNYEEVGDFVKSTSAPLVMQAPLDWTFKTFATGHLAVERRPWTAVSNQRYEKQMDVLAHDSAADMQPGLGQIGLPEFRRRGGTYGGQNFYGWQNWGDVAWGNGWSSLHYDLPFGVLFNWLRTGDYAFFDMARDLVAHRRDYDQDHSQDPLDLRRGGQFYEKGWFHGNYHQPVESHTWLQGMLLWYVTTGDEGAYEAALECGDFLVRMDAANWDGYWGSRRLGWSLEGMMNLWNYLGDFSHLQHAYDIVQNWKSLEDQWGGLGYVPNAGSSTQSEQTWQHAIVFNALSKYYLAVQDPGVLPVMQRMRDWMLNHAICTNPGGATDNFTLGTIWTRARHDWAIEPSMHHCWTIIEALSHAAIVLDDTESLDMAGALWEGVTRFHQHNPLNTGSVDLTDNASFSPIAFRMMMYPNSESKIMSNIALWSHAYPAARLLFDGNW